METRIGIGYDVHKLVENRPLIIGGVKIEHEKGLLGHSDADVLIHAVMDSLLGAAALGDIGKHFPDTDPKYSGADSAVLLGHVGELIKNEGYSISNIDSIIAAQAPKMAPHIEKMRENIAAALNIETDRVSVKATTTEEMGFEGRREGISAQAVCLIYKRRDIIMSEDYDNISKKYDQFRAADKSNIDYLVNEAGINSNTIVLDFGSGTGNHAIELKQRTGAAVYGVEPSDGMRENAVQKGSGVKFLKGDHKNIPLKNSSVDLIYMTDVIHHVPNLVMMFDEFARVLRPKGKVCIITESYKQIESRFWMRFFPTAITAEKERYPDVDDIIAAAESCGLKHIKTDVSDRRRKHKISKEFVELAENKGFSMFDLISETDYRAGLENLKAAYKSGEIQDYTHGESFIWLNRENAAAYSK